MLVKPPPEAAICPLPGEEEAEQEIRLESLCGGQDLLGVAGDFDLAPNFRDPPVAVDEEGRALDTEDFRPYMLFSFQTP